VARFTEGQGDQIDATRVGTIIGTPSYMSPEQVQGQPIDRRSDLFSAGIIFYQLLTWQKPFTGTQWEPAKKITEDDPPWPSKLVDIPADIDRIVARAMAKQRERRYETAQKFAEAIQCIAQGKPLEGHEDALTKPHAPAAKPGEPTEAEREFWNEVRESEDPDDLALYVEQFPKGAFVVIAQKRIAKLREKKG
jgi:eukaryotic-like serine/threonine-protein kinase